MTLFERIKKNVKLTNHFSKLTGIQLKQVGENTYAPEDEVCVFCQHRECLRIKEDETCPEESFYNCFSCDEHGDVINLNQKLLNLSSQLVSAIAIAKEYKIEVTDVKEYIRELSSDYYHNCLLTDTTKYKELGGLTPLEYQVQIRKHSEEAIKHFRIGWSDGQLSSYLLGLGIDTSEVKDVGLINARNSDFLPAKSFIYPHGVNGSVGHFTFKDPTKALAYQIKFSQKNPNHFFYNQDSIRDNSVVIIVEGENDVISLHESRWKGGCIGSIGTISGKQIQWCLDFLSDRNIVTIFDSDEAGEKYREKFGKIKNKFNSLVQIVPTPHKDVDEYFKNGGSLADLLNRGSPSETTNVSVSSDETEIATDSNSGSNGILEKDGAYYRVIYKEGIPTYKKLTNFIINRRYVFIKEGGRFRDVIIVREDGKRSRPFPVDSETKVSLKSFRVMIANAIDGSYYGSEGDLVPIWDHVSSTSEEKEIHIPFMVGRLDEHGGWLFRNVFIRDSGEIVEPDEEGIFWLDGKKYGVKATSINEADSQKGENDRNVDIPDLSVEYLPEEREEIFEGLVKNLSTNLGDTGLALTILGWANAVAYSNIIFEKTKCFPFLWIWGKYSGGKSTILRWVHALYGMQDKGVTTKTNYRTGVGFQRMAAYYSSLPISVDEMRQDHDSRQIEGDVRSFYNRYSRPIGTKDTLGVKLLPIRAVMQFCGQDLPEDLASKSRCISIVIPSRGREMKTTFNWLESRVSVLNVVGLKWILEAGKCEKGKLYEEIEECKQLLVTNGCNPRFALSYSLVLVFGRKISSRFFPTFDFQTYIINQIKNEAEVEHNESLATQFFETIEGLQSASDRPKIDGTHMLKEGNELYIWFSHIFRIYSSENKLKEDFSKAAVLHAIKEEPYYLRSDRKGLGVRGVQRRVLVLDIDKAPDSIKNIAEFLG